MTELPDNIPHLPQYQVLGCKSTDDEMHFQVDVPDRSLPRQADSCKGEFARSHCWRKTLGGRLPSDSCGRSSL
ncbi:hypothetical protein CO614_09725 [Lysobacteraceae bacterium NML120232]|nr:hypothetical protein CO614_09725 [Xanthomonadaceae bacterium NML120232]